MGWRQPTKGKSLGKELFNIATKTVNNGPHVVMFPEYCVPLHAFEEFIRLLSDPKSLKKWGERIYILGSHIDERGYNACPVVHVNGGKIDVYFSYKTELTDQEKDRKQLAGSSRCAFRTSFGNILVEVCRDAFQSNTDFIRDIDLLLIPSYHSGDWGSLPKMIYEKTGSIKAFCAFGNGAPTSKKVTDGRTNRSFTYNPTRMDDKRVKTVRTSNKKSTKCGLLFNVIEDEISLLSLDQSRVTDESGNGRTAANNLFPVHRDKWPDNVDKNVSDSADRRLDKLLHSRPPGSQSLKDVFLIDWEEAEAGWRET
jgi:hypothetical protein